MFNKNIVVILFVVSISMVAFHTAAAQIVEDGLVSYWHLDNLDVKDAVGPNDGDVIGRPKLVDGKYGKALSFNGQVDSVSFDNKGFPTGNSAMTWSAWFYREVSDAGAVQYIATSGIAACCGQFFGIGTRGGDMVFMTQWGGQFDAIGPVVSVGDWHHVAAVYNGSQNDTIYLNGEEVFSKDLDEAPNLVDTNTGAIGSNSGNPDDPEKPDPSEFFEGLIDDVGLYNRALSADDVAQNFLATVAVEPAGKLTSTWADIKSTK
jgi:hypothetical protein